MLGEEKKKQPRYVWTASDATVDVNDKNQVISQCQCQIELLEHHEKSPFSLHKHSARFAYAF